MPFELKKIIRDYYTEVRHAYKTKEINSTRLHLADKANLIGLNEFFEGKKAIVKMYSNLVNLIKDVDIQHQYFDPVSCCTYLNLITIIPEIQIKSTERIVVVNGHIIEISIIYDTIAWQNLMQFLQNLTSSASFFQNEVSK